MQLRRKLVQGSVMKKGCYSLHNKYINKISYGRRNAEQQNEQGRFCAVVVLRS